MAFDFQLHPTCLLFLTVFSFANMRTRMQLPVNQTRAASPYPPSRRLLFDEELKNVFRIKPHVHLFFLMSSSPSEGFA